MSHMVYQPFNLPTLGMGEGMSTGPSFHHGVCYALYLVFNLRSVLCSCTVSLTGVDMGHTTSKVAIRFANILRNLIPSSDVGVMEMTANAMGKLALASSTITAEYVEYESKRAFEWLSGDRHEGRRHAAVSSTVKPCLLCK